jgi:uncharacterized peroxidase-related enzyme
MTAIELINKEDMTPVTDQIFTDLKKQYGVVPNIYRMLAHSPDIIQNYQSHIQFLTKADGLIDAISRHMIVLLVARLTNCQYLYGWFSLFVKQHGIDTATMTAISGDYRKSTLSAKTKSILAYAEKITVSPLSISDRERDRLSEIGLNSKEIIEIAAIASCANSVARLVLSLGVPFET